MKDAAATAAKKFNVSERRACRALNLNRSGVRYVPVKKADEDALTGEIIRLACNYGRYGYRRITHVLQSEGYCVNHKRVERIWREQGLRVPGKMPKKRRIFYNDSSCVRLRAEHPDHVWSYDFVEDRLMNGTKLRWLNVIDEYTRECLASIPARSWSGRKVIEALADIMLTRKTPEYIRSDNGPEFVAKKLRDWLASVNVHTAYIEPGSPWENGYCESFNSKMRDEFLNVTMFASFREAEVLTKRWIHEYNYIRPHSSLNYRPPAYQVVLA